MPLRRYGVALSLLSLSGCGERPLPVAVQSPPLAQPVREAEGAPMVAAPTASARPVPSAAPALPQTTVVELQRDAPSDGTFAVDAYLILVRPACPPCGPCPPRVNCSPCPDCPVEYAISDAPLPEPPPGGWPAGAHAVELPRDRFGRRPLTGSQYHFRIVAEPKAHLRVVCGDLVTGDPAKIPALWPCPR